MNKIDLIYHADYKNIEFPGIKKEISTKDFSWGFYCTSVKEQAEEAAAKYNKPVINVYSLKNLDFLNVKIFICYCDEWLDFVMYCRDGNVHEYDVVIGPMADDTIYDYIEAYKHNQMNKENFYKLMKSKYPSNQISFHTIRALDCIEYVDSYTL